MWCCKTFMQVTPLILTPTGRLSLMMAHEIYLNLLMNGVRGASSTTQARELDFDVLAGGPGESWANPHVQVV